MEQTLLKFGPASPRARTTKAHDYDARNLESARLILADIEGHGGDRAGVVIWARAVTARLLGAES